ncbi:MAG: MarC family protein [Deltaproteobacteria bacterium]|nr:MarC family protein [Deltaproteobacteria bacterium]MDZ4224580.1 MarC family protein [bacterium]
MDDVTFYIKAFITLLVLVNPLEGVPVFLAATQSANPELTKKISRTAPVAIVIILLASLFLGSALLKLFGISAGAFQTGGGAILFLIAVKMVLGPGKSSFEEMSGGALSPSFAVVPLAIPIFAGPGAINGAVLYGTRAHSFFEMGILAGVIVLVGLAAYLSLRAAMPIVRYIKETGINIATRVMGLIIAAISVEMMAHGIAAMFPPRFS